MYSSQACNSLDTFTLILRFYYVRKLYIKPQMTRQFWLMLIWISKYPHAFSEMAWVCRAFVWTVYLWLWILNSCEKQAHSEMKRSQTHVWSGWRQRCSRVTCCGPWRRCWSWSLSWFGAMRSRLGVVGARDSPGRRAMTPWKDPRGEPRPNPCAPAMSVGNPGGPWENGAEYAGSLGSMVMLGADEGCVGTRWAMGSRHPPWEWNGCVRYLTLLF